MVAHGGILDRLTPLHNLTTVLSIGSSSLGIVTISSMSRSRMLSIRLWLEVAAGCVSCGGVINGANAALRCASVPWRAFAVQTLSLGNDISTYIHQ